MEPVWNGILTCDYERTRPDASPLEWDLYTRSLISWPAALMGEPAPYGQLRRPGIVDISQDVHEILTRKWHERLAEPSFVAGLIADTGKDRSDTSAALDSCAAAADSAILPALKAATAGLLRVNATHIVNWLLPEEHWETLLTSLLGTRTEALTCLSALQLPDTPSHILAAHGRTASAGDEASQFASSSRIRARERRDAWYLAALLAAGDGPALSEVRALAAVLGWAATSEERRNELRTRYLAAVGTWCAAAGLDPGQITTADLLGRTS